MVEGMTLDALGDEGARTRGEKSERPSETPALSQPIYVAQASVS